MQGPHGYITNIEEISMNIFSYGYFFTNIGGTKNYLKFIGMLEKSKKKMIK